MLHKQIKNVRDCWCFSTFMQGVSKYQDGDTQRWDHEAQEESISATRPKSRTFFLSLWGRGCSGSDPWAASLSDAAGVMLRFDWLQRLLLGPLGGLVCHDDLLFVERLSVRHHLMLPQHATTGYRNVRHLYTHTHTQTQLALAFPHYSMFKIFKHWIQGVFSSNVRNGRNDELQQKWRKWWNLNVF